MSVFCSSSSKSGTLVSKVADCLILPFLYPPGLVQTSRSRPRRRRTSRAPPQTVSSTNGLETWFFSSLAGATLCQKHRPRTQQPCYFAPQRPSATRKQGHIYGASYRRQQHTTAPSDDVDVEGEQPNRTKEELMALVDQYSGDSYTDQLPLLELPRLYQPADGPHLTVSDNPEEEWPPPFCEWPADPDTKQQIDLLEEALRDYSKDPEEIHQLYRCLPSPRAPYLRAKTRHKLLHHLSVVERKDQHSMIRFFSVVDDMKRTAIPLSVTEWTSAISFAARYVSRSTEVEVEAALHMWREMEHVAGVKGSDATFNVLYDVACKAGKFVLAEMIYREMAARGLEFNRYHHVSLIFHCGLKGDGDGARVAYKALVEAGEMVDTVVLNSIIAALVRSHEANAAESIYERMKNIYMEDNDFKLPPRDYKKAREVTKALMKMAMIVKKDPDRREEFQKKTIIAPDVHTYQILVNYFAITAGELGTAAKFLDEMKLFKIPLHGSLFMALFQGFSTHGGIRYTEWSEQRLESVWDAFIQALDDGVEDVFVERWIVVWGLKAFAKCSGKSRTLEVWEQLKDRWDPGEIELDQVMAILHTQLEAPDMGDKRDEWLLKSLR